MSFTRLLLLDRLGSWKRGTWLSNHCLLKHISFTRWLFNWHFHIEVSTLSQHFELLYIDSAPGNAGLGYRVQLLERQRLVLRPAARGGPSHCSSIIIMIIYIYREREIYISLSLYIYTYIYIYMYMCVYVYIYIHIYLSIYLSISLSVRIYIYIYTYIYIYILTVIHTQYIYIYICTHVKYKTNVQSDRLLWDMLVDRGPLIEGP